MYCSNKHTPAPPWVVPDPLMVGIRSPDGLVVGSCTSHPGVLGSIPTKGTRENRAPPLCSSKVQGSSRVPDYVTVHGEKRSADAAS
jgi:hypothetical protein